MNRTTLLKTHLDGKEYQVWYDYDASLVGEVPKHAMEYCGKVVFGKTFDEASRKIREVIQNSVIAP